MLLVYLFICLFLISIDTHSHASKAICPREIVSWGKICMNVCVCVCVFGPHQSMLLFWWLIKDCLCHFIVLFCSQSTTTVESALVWSGLVSETVSPTAHRLSLCSLLGAITSLVLISLSLATFSFPLIPSPFCLHKAAIGIWIAN